MHKINGDKVEGYFVDAQDKVTKAYGREVSSKLSSSYDTKRKAEIWSSESFADKFESDEKNQLSFLVLARLKQILPTERVRGFFYNGKVVILADQVNSENNMVNTFYHEHQHTVTTEEQIDGLIAVYKRLTKGNEEDARKQLVLDVQKLSGVHTYDKAGVRVLADELIAHMVSVQLMNGRITGEISRTVKNFVKKISNGTKERLNDNGGSTNGNKQNRTNERGGSGQNERNNEAKPKNDNGTGSRHGSGRVVSKGVNPKSHVLGKADIIDEVKDEFFEITKNCPVDVTLTTTEEFAKKIKPKNDIQTYIHREVINIWNAVKRRAKKYDISIAKASTTAGFYVNGEHIYIFAEVLDKPEYKNQKSSNCVSCLHTNLDITLTFKT